jgi:hypothetical protein
MSAVLDERVDEPALAGAWLRQSVDLVEAAGRQGDAWLAPLIAEHAERVLLPLALRLPMKVRDAWQRRCAAGWRGDAARVHADRESFLQYVDVKLSIIQLGRRLVALLTQQLKREFAEENELAGAEADLLSFKTAVFDRWRTLEDLEDLLAASFPLTNAELLAIAERHPAPPSWLEEDSKPF